MGDIKFTAPQKQALILMLQPTRTGKRKLPRNCGAKLRSMGLVEGGYQGLFNLTEQGRCVALQLADCNVGAPNAKLDNNQRG